MKRKYGAALARETEVEKLMRQAAAEMKDNRANFGTKTKMGSPTRGKSRNRAAKPAWRR